MFKRILALLFCTGLLPTVALAGDTFVVTSTENKQKIQDDDVKAIFLGDIHKWETGKEIVLVVPDLSSPEGEKLLEKVFAMSAKDYKKYWMQKVFKGEVTSPPENKNGDSMKQFLKAYPNAIGILPSALVDGSLRKVSKID